jgi:hypothetical protein
MARSRPNCLFILLNMNTMAMIYHRAIILITICLIGAPRSRVRIRLVILGESIRADDQSPTGRALRPLLTVRAERSPPGRSTWL